MQMIFTSFSGADGMTYANFPTLLRWYESVTLSFEEQTLDRIRLRYRLQDAGEGPTKLQRLRRGLPVSGLIDTERV